MKRNPLLVQDMLAESQATTDKSQSKLSLHPEFLCEGGTLFKGRMLIGLIEFIERCELDLGMTNARLFELVPGLLRLDGHGCRVGVCAVCVWREGRKLEGGREEIAHGGEKGRDRESSTKSLTTTTV